MLRLEFDQPWGALRVPYELLDLYAKLRDQGATVHVTITPNVKGRTMSQNSLFHTLMRELSEQTGYTSEEVKDMVKRYAVGLGFPAHEVDGRLEPIGSSEATVEDMETLIDAAYMWADENELRLRRR